jgi:xanthine dehydrogenase accessory factor
VGASVMGTSQRQLLAAVSAAVDAGETVCVATVVQTSRSVPRRAGSKMLVYADGRAIGTIGGGEMESRVVRAALEAIADRSTRLCTYQLVDPSTGDPGVCGGEATISLEPFMPTPTVYVVGCGHVGKSVVELAHWMGFRVIATDDRPDLATSSELPLADGTVSGHITEALKQFPITAETHVVVVTRNMAIDLELLPHLVATPARSIGVMGSARRWDETRTALLAAGAAATDLNRITAPIGLELHAETPEEIAVSILAEIVSLRRSPGVE